MRQCMCTIISANFSERVCKRTAGKKHKLVPLFSTHCIQCCPLDFGLEEISKIRTALRARGTTIFWEGFVKGSPPPPELRDRRGSTFPPRLPLPLCAALRARGRGQPYFEWIRQGTAARPLQSFALGEGQFLRRLLGYPAVRVSRKHWHMGEGEVGKGTCRRQNFTSLQNRRLASREIRRSIFANFAKLGDVIKFEKPELAMANATLQYPPSRTHNR